MTRIQLIALQMLVIGLCWFGFRWYYIGVGKGQCAARGNINLYEGQVKRDKKAGEISTASKAKAEAAAAKAEEDAEQAASRVEVVYRDRWKTVPGKCAINLDPRVQSEIDQAVQRTNQE